MDYTGVEEPKGFQAVPKGRYLARFEAAECSISKKGNPMITLTGEIIDGPHTGRKFWDWIVTGKNPQFPDSPAAGYGLKKMRSLGIDTSRPVPDEVIAGELLQRQFAVELDIQPQEDANGKVKTETDSQGRVVALTRNVVSSYDTSGTRLLQTGATSTSYVHQAVQPQAPVNHTAPAQFQGQPGVQYVQGTVQAPHGYPAPPPPPNGYAQAPWNAIAADQGQADLTVDGGQRRVRR